MQWSMAKFESNEESWEEFCESLEGDDLEQCVESGSFKVECFLGSCECGTSHEHGTECNSAERKCEKSQKRKKQSSSSNNLVGDNICELLSRISWVDLTQQCLVELSDDEHLQLTPRGMNALTITKAMLDAKDTYAFKSICFRNR